MWQPAHPGLITRDMVKPGAVVLDFGVNAVPDGIVGDVAFDEVSEVAGAITPVPGGTGPVTALVLARNTVAAGFASLGGHARRGSGADAGGRRARTATQPRLDAPDRAGRESGQICYLWWPRWGVV